MTEEACCARARLVFLLTCMAASRAATDPPACARRARAARSGILDASLRWSVVFPAFYPLRGAQVVEELQAPKQLRAVSPPSQRPRTDTSGAKPRTTPPTATDLFGGTHSPPSSPPPPPKENSYASPTGSKSDRERIQDALDSKAAVRGFARCTPGANKSPYQMNRAMQMQYTQSHSSTTLNRADDYSSGAEEGHASGRRVSARSLWFSCTHKRAPPPPQGRRL